MTEYWATNPYTCCASLQGENQVTRVTGHDENTDLSCLRGLEALWHIRLSHE